MSWKITATYDGLVDDPDANSYLSRVEAADGQILEPAVRLAINNFVKGCKADGTFDAIKACCIMAGARTLSGALTPLVGPAPTNFNFVSGDYNRRTGLVGNGSTKYLNSNRAANADPQNSSHISVYVSELISSVPLVFVGAGPATSTKLISTSTGPVMFYRLNNGGSFALGVPSSNRFYGASRSESSSFIARNQTNGVSSVESVTPSSFAITVFARNDVSSVISFSNDRLAFYSIGESLDLALLDARVTALMNGLAAVLP